MHSLVSRIVLASVLFLGSEAYAGGKTITLPDGRVVSTSDKILSGGHFTWSEATKNGTRIPANEEIVKQIESSAKYMEEIREYFGNKPIIVNSWYRDDETNKKVGGARDSQHKYGRAVDFNVKGLTPRQVQEKLENYWADKGGVGRYNDFTHVDNRGKKARW